MNTDPLLQAYLVAEYWVDGFSQPIRIGEHSEELEDLLARRGARTWGFITAWNPMSKLLPEPENHARNLALQDRLRTYRLHEGEGRDPAGEWAPERSFLVLGIPYAEALEIGREFGQRAIVFGEAGGVARLVETLTKHGGQNDPGGGQDGTGIGP